MELNVLNIPKNKINQFNSKGIYTVYDLINYLPKSYKDYTKLTGFLPEDQDSCIVLLADRFNTYFNRSGKLDTIVLKGYEVSTRTAVSVVWFNQKWRAPSLPYLLRNNVFVAGKATPNKDGGYTFIMPEIFDPDINHNMKIFPVYRKIDNMSMSFLTSQIQKVLHSYKPREILPEDVVYNLNQLPMQYVFQYLHAPNSMQEVLQAQDRLIYNDLIYFALQNEWNSREISCGSQFNVTPFGLELVKRIAQSLPYQLTHDQQKTVDEMISCARAGRRINALIQGDVGCGKTITAALIMAAFVGSGYQAVLMAPTKALAHQHYEDFVKLFEPHGIKVAYLGGEKLKKAQQVELMNSISSGEAKIVIGTHAAISKDVKYKDIAITVVDEEHRFGVMQRAAIVEKAARGVHSITMSATPIPRSLATVVYGDTVQLHTIRTMPNGRQPVATAIISNRDRIYRAIVGQVRNGRQAYVVCPMIENSTTLTDVKSVEQTSIEYHNALDPYGIRIETLTGRTAKKDADEILEKFHNGQIDVLISTTVVEVGMNVPNATIMIISNAERFGLSQMHQLRGRVGRSTHVSACILESKVTSGPSLDRMKTLCSTTNGFEIAQADLKQRGAGDFLGTKQSGDNKYVSLMLAYPQRYEIAKKVADDLINRGPNCCELAHQIYMEHYDLA